MKKAKHTDWTKDEIAFLKIHYEKEGVPFIVDALKRVTGGVYAKARKLGLKRKDRLKISRRKYTEDELRYVKENYEKCGPYTIAEELHRSPESVRQKAKLLKLKWNKSKICEEEGCNRPHDCRGYCKLHYTRRKRTGEFNDELCKIPGCMSYADNRGYCYKHYREKYNKGEFAVKKCKSKKCDVWAHSNGFCKRCNDLDKTYGISLEEYNILLEYQEYKCACCNNKETSKQCGKIKRLAVDHIHGTWLCRDCGYVHENDKRPKKCPKCGAVKSRFRRDVRGLLCSRCNGGIGIFGDNLDEIIRNVNRYKNYIEKTHTHISFLKLEK